MNTFNNFERKISIILASFPKIKFFLKKIYQKLNFIFYKKNFLYKINSNMLIEKISNKNEESFFGYYGKSPLNKLNKYLIFHSTSHKTIHKPDNKKSINIVLFDFENNIPIKIFKTFAYNWQQGSKLQWVDENFFIFNDYDKNKDVYISKIIDSRKNKIHKIIDYPIYDVMFDFALSVNFDRLSFYEPDYGYKNKKNISDINNLKDDGVFLINLKDNSSRLIISLENIINAHYKDSMKGAKHWINHIILSPNGKKFIFIHRWSNKGKRFDSLFLSDVKGKLIECIADDGMVSHCCWKNNNEIIVFKRNHKLGDKYFLINLVDGSERLLFNSDINTFGDGHPTVYNKYLLFDTYPDKSRMKHLMCFNMDNKKNKKIGLFFESLNYYGETRCDLHPRWSIDGKNIFIDSVHTGNRFLYKIELEQ